MLFRRVRAEFSDGVIDLLPLRLYPPEKEMGFGRVYDYMIVPHGTHREVGRISLRMGESPCVYYFGHIGYHVDPPYRGNHYARRACALLRPLIALHGKAASSSRLTRTTGRAARRAWGWAARWKEPWPCRRKSATAGKSAPSSADTSGESTAEKEMRFVEMTLQGVRVHYEIGGHGERKVVLLHGWGCSEKLMAGISDALTPDMTVLRVDFPAHGESGFPPQPWGVPDFAANLLELLTKLDFLPCSVIAHSFGGRVAIELAADHPERFEKLILTGAAGIRPKLSSEKSKKSQRYQRLKKLVGVAKKTHLFGSLPDKWQENLVQKYGSRDYAALSPEMRKTFVKVVGYDQSALLSHIKNPTLLIWGDRDTETPLWMGQQMEKEIADSGLVVLEGGTHFAYLEQATRFQTIVRQFLLN